MDTFRLIVSILLLFFFITDVAAAYLLTKTTARANYSLVALNERAFVATIQSASAFLLAALGANRIFGWNFSDEVALIAISAALLLQAVPSIVWLYLFLRHKFDRAGRIKE